MMMNAVQVMQHGGVETLKRNQVPIPTPGRSEVLVKIKACALNNSDIMMRIGGYGSDTDEGKKTGWNREGISFPRIPGSDIAGEIVEVGHDVTKECLGSKVVLFPIQSSGKEGTENMSEDMAYIGSEFDGGYAEYVVWPADLCYPMPLNSFEESATLPVSGITSWHMIEKINLKQNETVLVTGSSGGVGTFNVQIASKLFGAHVIAVVGDLSMSEKMKELGAEKVVSYRSGTFLDDMMGAANGSVDVVLDVVGEALFKDSLAALRTGGRFITAGAVSEPLAQFDIRTLYLKHLTLVGSSLGTKAGFKKLLEAAKHKKIVPIVEKTFPLAEAKEAQISFKTSGKLGKTVLIP